MSQHSFFRAWGVTFQTWARRAFPLPTAASPLDDEHEQTAVAALAERLFLEHKPYADAPEAAVHAAIRFRRELHRCLPHVTRNYAAPIPELGRDEEGRPT